MDNLILPPPLMIAEVGQGGITFFNSSPSLLWNTCLYLFTSHPYTNIHSFYINNLIYKILALLFISTTGRHDSIYKPK